MHISTLPPSSSFSSSFFSKTEHILVSRTDTHFTPFTMQTKPRKQNPKKFRSFKCMRNNSANHDFSSISCATTLTVAEKTNLLASEFRSLTEPIDRVKRLLDYATLLPPFDESQKGLENRVFGCTAQVWLEVKMVDNGSMRFRVDSDSEITKGFCSCLILLLDNGAPEEILNVELDDLFEMNIGSPSRGYSRVNTWHNVLISMQKRTKVLMEERDRKKKPLQDFSSSIVWPDLDSVKSSFELVSDHGIQHDLTRFPD